MARKEPTPVADEIMDLMGTILLKSEGLWRERLEGQKALVFRKMAGKIWGIAMDHTPRPKPVERLREPREVKPRHP